MQKFLVDKEGHVVDRFSSLTKPSSLADAIEKVLWKWVWAELSPRAHCSPEHKRTLWCVVVLLCCVLVFHIGPWKENLLCHSSKKKKEEPTLYMCELFGVFCCTVQCLPPPPSPLPCMLCLCVFPLFGRLNKLIIILWWSAARSAVLLLLLMLLSRVLVVFLFFPLLVVPLACGAVQSHHHFVVEAKGVTQQLLVKVEPPLALTAAVASLRSTWTQPVHAISKTKRCGCGADPAPGYRHRMCVPTPNNNKTHKGSFVCNSFLISENNLRLEGLGVEYFAVVCEQLDGVRGGERGSGIKGWCHACTAILAFDSCGQANFAHHNPGDTHLQPQPLSHHHSKHYDIG